MTARGLVGQAASLSWIIIHSIVLNWISSRVVRFVCVLKTVWVTFPEALCRL